MKYRPEIDGLRAIAVILVFLYHAGIAAFKGGFIGVDIFFVISGFLITTIILRDLSQDKFSFAEFYERRARRILPTLFLVMLTTLPFAWHLMLPDALKEYGRSLVTTIFFGSNIQFWLEDSYVAEASILKPFLHTWTLSLEEQFYFIFPVLMIFCWKHLRRHILLVMVGIFAVSLFTAEWGSRKYVDANFYLLHSRIWELLAGSILAKLEIDRGRSSATLLNKIMPAIGLSLIAFSVYSYNETDQHPSLHTLLPVLGASLFIWFSGKGDAISRLLSSKTFVTLGLMSYSIYLWHQPIFAFLRIYQGLTISGSQLLFAAALTLALSVISWKIVESPFRTRSKIKDNVFWKSLVGVSVALVVFGSTSMRTKGFPGRMSASIIESAAPQFTKFEQDKRSCWERPNFPDDNCRFGNEVVIVLGDSSIASLLPTLSVTLKTSSYGMFDLTWGQCPYHEGIDHGAKGCAEINAKRDKYIKGLSSKKIFIMGHNLTQLYKASSSSTQENVPFENAVALVRKKISGILELGHKVVLIKQLPPVNQNTAQLLMFARTKNMGQLPRLKGKDRPSIVLELDKIYDGLPHSENLIVIDPKSSFCDLNKDVCWANEGENFYFSDRFNHLSAFGAERIIKVITRTLKERWNLSL